MKLNSGSLIVRFFRDQSAQMLPIMAFLVVVFMSIAAFSVSVGSTYIQQHELQNSANAAALAGAQALPDNTAATNAANAYSSQSGDNNSNSYMPGATMASNYPKLECLSTLTNLGVLCVAPANANAIQVKQQITVPILFGGLFGGKSTTTLTATATASARGTGATIAPYNVAIIVDGTGSMSSTDSDSLCNNTRMTCALQGVRVLLQALSPCNMAMSSCGAVTAGTNGSGNVVGSVDRVALFQFPNASTSNIADLYNCNGTKPTPEVYTFPTAGATTYTPLYSSTYEVVGFSSDYKTSDTATTLNPAPKANSGNNLVKASGGLSGCTQMINTSGEGTYLAGAIYAAQSALIAEQASFPGSQNVLILISDGAANSGDLGSSASTTSGTYPSTKKQCAQAIQAGKDVATANKFGNGAIPTRVYSVAYGASSTASDCSTDSDSTINPCTTMLGIVGSATQNFFSDSSASQSKNQCQSIARPVTGLPEIFTIIAGDLAVAHLVPNNMT